MLCCFSRPRVAADAVGRPCVEAAGPEGAAPGGDVPAAGGSLRAPAKPAAAAQPAPSGRLDDHHNHHHHQRGLHRGGDRHAAPEDGGQQQRQKQRAAAAAEPQTRSGQHGAGHPRGARDQQQQQQQQTAAAEQQPWVGPGPRPVLRAPAAAAAPRHGRAAPPGAGGSGDDAAAAHADGGSTASSESGDFVEEVHGAMSGGGGGGVGGLGGGGALALVGAGGALAGGGALGPLPARARRRPPLRASSQKILKPKYQVAFEELVFHETIGKGSYKTVYRGRWANTSVAIVRMRKGGSVTEARMMQQLSGHPNLVQFYRWASDPSGNEFVVMELVPLGSLDKILAQFGQLLRTSAKFQMCEQIAAAMAALAREGVIHRDLAVRNVLVASIDPVHVKVGDFGLARETYARSQRALLQSLPVRWAPPEVVLRQEWGPASDVWAFGVTMWEIFANGGEPYASLTNEQVVRAVLAGQRLERPPRCPHEVYDVMNQCWATDPAERPSFDAINERFAKLREAARAGRFASDAGSDAGAAGAGHAGGGAHRGPSRTSSGRRRSSGAPAAAAAAAAPGGGALAAAVAAAAAAGALGPPAAAWAAPAAIGAHGLDWPSGHSSSGGGGMSHAATDPLPVQWQPAPQAAAAPAAHALDDGSGSAADGHGFSVSSGDSGAAEAAPGHAPGSDPLPWRSINEAVAQILSKPPPAAPPPPHHAAAPPALVAGDGAAAGAPAGAGGGRADGGVLSAGRSLSHGARALLPSYVRVNAAAMAAHIASGANNDNNSGGGGGGGRGAFTVEASARAQSFTQGHTPRGLPWSPSLDRLRMMQLQQLRLQALGLAGGLNGGLNGSSVLGAGAAEAPQPRGWGGGERRGSGACDAALGDSIAEAAEEGLGDEWRGGDAAGSGGAGSGEASGAEWYADEEGGGASGSGGGGEWDGGESDGGEGSDGGGGGGSEGGGDANSIHLSFTQEYVIDPRQESFSTVMSTAPSIELLGGDGHDAPDATGAFAIPWHGMARETAAAGGGGGAAQGADSGAPAGGGEPAAAARAGTGQAPEQPEPDAAPSGAQERRQEQQRPQRSQPMAQPQQMHDAGPPAQPRPGLLAPEQQEKQQQQQQQQHQQQQRRRRDQRPPEHHAAAVQAAAGAAGAGAPRAAAASNPVGNPVSNPYSRIQDIFYSIT